MHHELCVFTYFNLTNNCRPTANPISLTNKDRKAIFFQIEAYQKVTWADLGFESVSIINVFKINGSHDLHVKIQPKKKSGFIRDLL